MLNSSTKIEVVGDLDFFLFMMEEASFVDPHQPSILSFISFNPMAENMI
jgi:hypothetical protein